MKKTVASTLVAGAIAAMAFTSTVRADDAEGAFLGAGAGWNQYADIGGFGLPDVKDTVAYRLFGGYTFNQYWGIEAGHNWQGHGKLDGDTYRASGYNLSVLPRYPLTDKISLISELGLMFSKVHNDNPLFQDRSASETNGVFGLGAAYRVADPLDLQLRYRIMNQVGTNQTGETNIHNVNLEAVYYPTRTTAMAPAPTPAPAPAPAPEPKIEVQTFTLSSDVMFDFNKATLKPKGKTSLDQLLGDIQAKQPKDGSVVVYGYTDRIGSEAYNQRLSEARANTVADYFKMKGMAADKISAIGRGEADPVTGSSCDGIKSRKQLIVCLAPDRRVTIEVSGTREEVIK